MSLKNWSYRNSMKKKTSYSLKKKMSCNCLKNLTNNWNSMRRMRNKS
jgi:hypothetical protein